MLFGEGMYEVLGKLPYNSQQEANIASHRMSVFIDQFGLTDSVKKNVIEILVQSFFVSDLSNIEKLDLKVR